MRNPLTSLARRLGAQRWTMRFAPLILFLERHLRDWTGNRASLTSVAGLVSLRITVPGRKTGLPRTATVMGVPYRDGMIVIGSNWGRSRHPAWSANLREVRFADVQIGARHTARNVRMATGEERERLWRRALDYWPGYAMEAQLAGGREFRVFVLEPVAPSARGERKRPA